VDLVALSNGLHGSVQMDLVALFSWIGWLRHRGILRYVANSPYTVLGESYSAGRLYDKISEEASGKVKFKLDKGVICELIEQ